MRVAAKLVISLLALVAFTLAIALVLLATAGDDFTRRLLHHQLAGIIDRKVRVDGAISLDVSLELTLRVADVSIANPPWASGAYLAHL